MSAAGSGAATAPKDAPSRPQSGGTGAGTGVSAKVDAAVLLEATDSLLAQLGDISLNEDSVNWDEFPAFMKMWDILWLAQERVLQEAGFMLSRLNARRQQAGAGKAEETAASELEGLRAPLEEIRESKLEERSRFFKIGLFWRRQAIWHCFRTHLNRTELARDMVHLYLVKPAGGVGVPETGEICRPKCATKKEQEYLLTFAGTQRNRIRELGRWLNQHPDLASALSDTKGKGKGRARSQDAEEELQKLKQHLESRLEAFEPRNRLEELLTATKNWIESFKARVEFIQDARVMVNRDGVSLVSTVAQRSFKLKQTGKVASVNAVPASSHTSQQSPPVATAASTSPPPAVSKKRKRTVDRGTSPLSEVPDNSVLSTRGKGPMSISTPITTSTKVEQSTMTVDIDEGNPVPPMAKAVITTMQDSIETTEVPVLDDDSPPSPQSLPSPPPHGQTRLKPQTQSGQDDSQTSTGESSTNAAGHVPSIHTLPPAESSNPSDHAFHAIIAQDVVPSTVAHEAKTSKREQKKRKRVCKLPPVDDTILDKLRQAALQVERQRQEEKRKELVTVTYDYWGDLRMWEPPVGMDEETGKYPSGQTAEEQSVHEQPLPAEGSASHTAVEPGPEEGAQSQDAKAKANRLLRTFDAFDNASQSDSGSFGRADPEEGMANIHRFLSSELEDVL